MQTSKKAFIGFISWCAVVQAACLFWAIKLQSEMLLAIFAGSAVVEPIAVYKFYLEYQREINLKHMEMNYQPNYDELE